jgi:hypothetical protein
VQGFVPAVSGIPFESIAVVLADLRFRLAALLLSILALEAYRVWAWTSQFRNSVEVLVASTVGATHFISVGSAIEQVRASRWGEAIYSKSAPKLSVWDRLSYTSGTVDPAESDRRRRFTDWIARYALPQFVREEPAAYRKVDDTQEFDAVVLKKWLSDKYEYKLLEEFGDV